MELELQTVDAILSGESPYLETYDHSERPWLDLREFRRCSDSVFERLVSNIGPLGYFWLGLEEVPLGQALRLRRLQIDVLFLTNLSRLDDDAAHALGDWRFGRKPIRNFKIAAPLSQGAARALVGKMISGDSCDRPLDLSLPSLSPEVADCLRHHTHELGLHLCSEGLTPEAAELLAKHAGYELTLSLPTRISDVAQLALARNPEKRISIQNGGTLIYFVDRNWWTSNYEEKPQTLDANLLGAYFEKHGITYPLEDEFVLDFFLAKRLMEDRLLPTLDRMTQLDLSVFSEITPEALGFLAGFDCASVRLGMRRLTPHSAAILSGWNLRWLIFSDNTEFAPSALEKLRGFAGNVSFGRLTELNRDAAVALSEINGEVSLSVPSLNVEVADALAKHWGRLAIRGLEHIDHVALAKLVRHQGDNLTLMLDFEPDQARLRAITSNPEKRVFRFKGEVYEALNSQWAAMVCSPLACDQFVRTYGMTDADMVAVEASAAANRIDTLSIADITN